jgi:hypothetical protein
MPSLGLGSILAQYVVNCIKASNSAGSRLAPVSAKHITMHVLDNSDLRCCSCLDICQILGVDSMLVVVAVSTDCSTTDPSFVIVSHDLDPDRSVTVGDDDCKDSVDLTLSVTCITLEVNLDIALTHGFPNIYLLALWSIGPNHSNGLDQYLDMTEKEPGGDMPTRPAPSLDLLDRAPISLCSDDLDADRFMDFMAMAANSIGLLWDFPN